MPQAHQQKRSGTDNVGAMSRTAAEDHEEETPKKRVRLVETKVVMAESVPLYDLWITSGASLNGGFVLLLSQQDNLSYVQLTML